MFNSLEKYIKSIDEVNQKINLLIKEDDVDKKDIDYIRSEINYLRNLIRSKSEIYFDFDKIRIDFRDETLLDLPSYGVGNEDRTLKGKMYFNVVGGTKKYLDLRTTSLPKSFLIRLTYETLEPKEKQKGYGYLVFESGSQYLEGKEILIRYEIIEKI